MAVAHLADELVIHDDLGDAACRQAADESGPPDIDIVDLQPEAGGKQDTERRDHAQKLALSVRRLEDDHDQIDVWPILGGDALQQGALLMRRAGRRLATDFPIAVLGFDNALGQSRGRSEVTEKNCEESEKRRPGGAA